MVPHFQYRSLLPAHWGAYFFSVLFCLLLLGCEEPQRVLRVEKVISTPSADILDLVASADDAPSRLFARTYHSLWFYQDSWKPISKSTSLKSGPATVEEHGSSVWFRDSFWWIDSTSNGFSLEHTRDGRREKSLPLPPVSRPLTDSSKTLDILEYGELVVSDSDLYYLTPYKIWRLDDSQDPPWEPINLAGVDFTSARLSSPKFIRNYLPMTSTRPFEILTLFQNDLRIFRRERGAAEFLLVSRLSTFDQQLFSTNDGSYIFLIASDGVYRSLDQGETWFRFWQSDDDSISSAIYVKNQTGKVPASLLLLGTENGHIFRSVDDGEEWEEVQIPEVHSRSVVRITSRQDGATIWIGIVGLGVYESTDFGVTWKQGSSTIRDSRPFALSDDKNGTFLLADLGGLWAMRPKPPARVEDVEVKKPTWRKFVSQNVSAFAPLDDVVIVGTVSGKLLQFSRSGVLNTSYSPEFQTPGIYGLSIRSVIGRNSLFRDSVVLLRTRSDGSEVQAWYRNGRILSSRDKGKTWFPIDIPKETREVLANQEVIDVQLAARNAIVMMTEAEHSERSLWLSSDDGKTWMQIDCHFGKLIGYRVIDAGEKFNGGFYIIARTSKTLFVSIDNGLTWTKLPGPWNNLNIIAMAALGDRLAVLVDSRLGYELITAEHPFSNDVRYERYELTWPSGYPDELPKLLIMGKSYFGILSANELWMIRNEHAEQTVSKGVLVVSQLLIIIVLTGILFLVLRMKGDKKRRSFM